MEKDATHILDSYTIKRRSSKRNYRTLKLHNLEKLIKLLLKCHDKTEDAKPIGKNQRKTDEREAKRKKYMNRWQEKDKTGGVDGHGRKCSGWNGMTTSSYWHNQSSDTMSELHFYHSFSNQEVLVNSYQDIPQQVLFLIHK